MKQHRIDFITEEETTPILHMENREALHRMRAFWEREDEEEEFELTDAEIVDLPAEVLHRRAEELWGDQISVRAKQLNNEDVSGKAHAALYGFLLAACIALIAFGLASDWARKSVSVEELSEVAIAAGDFDAWTPVVFLITRDALPQTAVRNVPHFQFPAYALDEKDTQSPVWRIVESGLPVLEAPENAEIAPVVVTDPPDALSPDEAAGQPLASSIMDSDTDDSAAAEGLVIAEPSTAGNEAPLQAVGRDPRSSVSSGATFRLSEKTYVPARILPPVATLDGERVVNRAVFRRAARQYNALRPIADRVSDGGWYVRRASGSRAINVFSIQITENLRTFSQAAQSIDLIGRNYGAVWEELRSMQGFDERRMYVGDHVYGFVVESASGVQFAEVEYDQNVDHLRNTPPIKMAFDSCRKSPFLNAIPRASRARSNPCPTDTDAVLASMIASNAMSALRPGK